MANLPGWLKQFMNKAITSLIFPDDPDLNLTAFDMGEDMATMSIDEDTVKRLKVAFGEVGAAEMAVPATITVSIVKTVASANIWRKRIFTNGLVGGVNRTCVFTDDVGNEYTLFACTLSMGEVSANASSPAYSFTVKGTLAVNTDLYGIFIG